MWLKQPGGGLHIQDGFGSNITFVSAAAAAAARKRRSCKGFNQLEMEKYNHSVWEPLRWTDRIQNGGKFLNFCQVEEWTDAKGDSLGVFSEFYAENLCSR